MYKFRVYAKNAIGESVAASNEMSATPVGIITFYTITFNKNDASATGTMTTQTVATGASASLTANGFSKTGYVFAGWATSTTGTVVYTNSASYTMGTTGIELFAKWTDSTTPNTPAKPLGVAQTGVTLAPSGETITVAASVASLSLNVTCIAGETVKLYNGTSLISLVSGLCSSTTKTISFALPSFADILYISATLTDSA